MNILLKQQHEEARAAATKEVKQHYVEIERARQDAEEKAKKNAQKQTQYLERLEKELAAAKTSEAEAKIKTAEAATEHSRAILKMQEDSHEKMMKQMQSSHAALVQVIISTHRTVHYQQSKYVNRRRSNPHIPK
jgi:hypothetical protein